MSWRSHLDIADVAARLLTNRTVTGTVPVGAIPGILGFDVAEGFSAHLGRPVTFDSNSPDTYGEMITPIVRRRCRGLVVDSYRHGRTQPGEVIRRNQSAQDLLGITTRTVQQWLTDLAVS